MDGESHGILLFTFVVACRSDVVQGQRRPVQSAIRSTFDLQEIYNMIHFTHLFNIGISLSPVLRISVCLCV